MASSDRCPHLDNKRGLQRLLGKPEPSKMSTMLVRPSNFKESSGQPCREECEVISQHKETSKDAAADQWEHVGIPISSD